MQRHVSQFQSRAPRRPRGGAGIRLRTVSGAALLALALVAGISAQTRYEFWPGTQYNASIPTMRQVLGYEPGERITAHSGLNTYLDALARASSQIRVIPYAESWEGRTLAYVMVGSAANIARLDAVEAGMHGSATRSAPPTPKPGSSSRACPRSRGSRTVCTATRCRRRTPRSSPPII